VCPFKVVLRRCDFYIGGVPDEVANEVVSKTGSPLTNLNGRIGGVRIYDQKLSAAEILARYQRQLPTNEE